MENQPHHWTNNVYLFNTFISFLFTHPIWDVTDTEVKTLCTLTISTHTSRVGCDNVRRIFSQCRSDFYSHIPCGMWHGNGLSINSSIKISTHTSRVGCDLPALHNIANRFYFYSHIPCGMWLELMVSSSTPYNFYSHIPCGMWQDSGGCRGWGNISTHTSRVGCDGVPSISVSWYKISTHTSRVGCDAESNQIAAAYINISTHTSRVGCDFSPSKALMCM